MSDGRLLPGQQYDRTKDLVISFTEQMRDTAGAATQLGDTRTEITPNSEDSYRVRVFGDPTDLDNLVISGASKANIILPDRLVGITLVYNENQGSGQYVEDNVSNSGGATTNLTVSLNGNAQNSFSIIADIIPDIRPTPGSNVPTQRYFFWMNPPVTLATILARLTAEIGSPVLAWPKFDPRPHTFIITGQSASVRADARVSQHVFMSASQNDYSLDTGQGQSMDSSVTIRTITLPPTIHGAITISEPLRQGRASALATAIIVGGTNFPAKLVNVSRETPLQTARITPTSLTATTPSSIPTSGLYLYDYTFESDLEFGRIKVFAEVVDMSYFA